MWGGRNVSIEFNVSSPDNYNYNNNNKNNNTFNSFFYLPADDNQTVGLDTLFSSFLDSCFPPSAMRQRTARFGLFPPHTIADPQMVRFGGLALRFSLSHSNPSNR